MTISPRTPSTPGNSLDQPIPEYDLAYERQRLRNKIHDAVLGHFLREVAATGITRAQLARKLNRRPEQITRWLSAPGNLTTDTISDLMYAMGLDPASILRDAGEIYKTESPHLRGSISASSIDKPEQMIGSVFKYLQARQSPQEPREKSLGVLSDRTPHATRQSLSGENKFKWN